MSRLFNTLVKWRAQSRRLVCVSIFRQSSYHFDQTKHTTTTDDCEQDTSDFGQLATHDSYSNSVNEIKERLDKTGIPEQYINVFVAVMKEKQWKDDVTVLTEKVSNLEAETSQLRVEFKQEAGKLKNEIASLQMLIGMISDVYDSTKITLILGELTKTLDYLGAVYFSFVRGEVVWPKDKAPQCMFPVFFFPIFGEKCNV